MITFEKKKRFIVLLQILRVTSLEAFKMSI